MRLLASIPSSYLRGRESYNRRMAKIKINFSRLRTGMLSVQTRLTAKSQHASSITRPEASTPTHRTNFAKSASVCTLHPRAAYGRLKCQPRLRSISAYGNEKDRRYGPSDSQSRNHYANDSLLLVSCQAGEEERR